MTVEPLVELKQVRKLFGDQRVLDGVDLRVLPKETLVIIGKSGTGKSITLRHMVGLEQPDEGTVLVFGEDISRLDKRGLDRIRLRMGYLFQSGALLNWLTVEENVELPLLEHRRDLHRKARREKVHEKLELVQMQDARGKYPSEISGGMKKRAALARAVVLEPEIVLYDEPTSGLDPVIANAINDLILRTGETLETTQVVVTHDMESAYRIADRIAMLYRGRIVATGTPDEIRDSRDPIVHQFITGDSRGPMTEGKPPEGPRIEGKTSVRRIS
jgi:phospholipid/cholesterol/gamma-HCH transport system ATP-binding protein